MKQSQKATLAVVVGLAGFLVTEIYGVVSDLPIDGDTDKVGRISQMPQAKRTTSASKNNASQTWKRQVQTQLGSARQVNLAPC